MDTTFSVFTKPHLTRGGLREFDTVMQLTLDYVSGLHNFREFSQPPEWLDVAM